MDKRKKKVIGKRCQKCESTQTYFKKRTKERVCNSCGYSEKLNKGEKS